MVRGVKVASNVNEFFKTPIRYCNEKSCFHLELDPGAQAMKDPPREERRKVTDLITDETP